MLTEFLIKDQPLITPEDTLNYGEMDESFTGPQLILSGNAKISLIGHNFGWDKERGISVIRSEIVIASAKKFSANGLFCIDVYMLCPANPKGFFYVDIARHSPALLLTGRLDFDEDKQDDSDERFIGNLHDLRDPISGKPYYLFERDLPKRLSEYHISIYE